MKKIFFVMASIAILMLDGCQEVASPLNTVPAVTTDAVEEFNGNYAYLSGKTSSKGECYFLVSTSEDMADARTVEAFSHKTEQDTEWLCSTEVGNLQPGITYYVVLCATDGCSEVRGNIVSFTTSSYLKIESAFTADGKPYEGDVLGIYLTDADNQVFGKYGNLRALGKNGTGYDLPYQFVVTEPTKVYAYIPYNEANSGNSLYVDVYNSQGDWDYQYGSCLVSKENPRANFEMQSAMAKLLFQIYVDEGVSSIGLLTLHLDDVAGNVTDKVSGSGSLNLATGEIVGDPGDGVDFAVKQWVDGGAYVTVEGYVIPTSFEDGEVEVSLNWYNDRGDGFLEFPIPAAKWEKGRIYEIPLTVSFPEEKQPAHIGDYYYSDGTFSSEYDANKECIGLVFALSNEELGPIIPELEESEHGRIVELSDFASGERYQWITTWDLFERVRRIPSFYGLDEDCWSGYLPFNGDPDSPDAKKEAQIEEELLLPYGFSKWVQGTGTNYALTDYDGLYHVHDYGYYDESAIGRAFAKSDEPVMWYLPALGELARLGMAQAAGYLDKPEYVPLKDDYWSSTIAGDHTWKYGIYETANHSLFQCDLVGVYCKIRRVTTF